MKTVLLMLAVAAQASAPESQLLNELMRGIPGAEARVEGALSGTIPEQDVRAKLISLLCHIKGMRGRYAEAARTCGSQVPGRESPEAIAFWRALAEVPPPRAIGSATLSVAQNWADLSEVPAQANGVDSRWAIDTGAEVSIVSASEAARMGVRPLNSELEVGTSTVPVTGRLGIIELLTLGDAAIENVVVLILPDERFVIADNNILPPILGLPNLVAFDRIAWIDGGGGLALGEAAPLVGANAVPLYWHDDGIGLLFQTETGERIGHFDSGANRTSLHPDALALLSPEERARISTREAKAFGAGGMITVEQQRVEKVTARIADVPVTLADLRVEESLGDIPVRIGMDFVGRLETLILDFDRMLVDGIPKSESR